MSDIDSQPDRTDLVIIGGGVMGTSIAYFATTELSLDVVLLEKDSIGSGSTGDSSAILRHHYGDDEIYARMAWWSHQFYRRFSEETGQQIAYEGSPLVRFTTDTKDSYALAGYETLQKLDIPVSKYEKEAFDDHYPMLSVDEYSVAISDDTAAYSDGADVAGGFARAAQNNGATVLTNTPVLEITTTNGIVDGVRTDRGDIDCQHVVLAAGPWTPHLAEQIDIEIPIRVEREQILILDPPEEYKDQYPELTPTTALPGGNWYIRSDFGDGILVATHHMGDRVDPEEYDNNPDESTVLELTDNLTDLVPELAESGIRGRYCGVYSTTPDHDFVIDEKKGCYLACGFSGHGFKHGPAIGKIVTDMIDSGESDLVDVDYFSLDRFANGAGGHSPPEDVI